MFSWIGSYKLVPPCTSTVWPAVAAAAVPVHFQLPESPADEIQRAPAARLRRPGGPVVDATRWRRSPRRRRRRSTPWWSSMRLVADGSAHGTAPAPAPAQTSTHRDPHQPHPVRALSAAAAAEGSGALD